jgi:hypothetical protein
VVQAANVTKKECNHFIIQSEVILYKPASQKEVLPTYIFQTKFQDKTPVTLKVYGFRFCPGIPTINQGIVVRLLAGAMYFPFQGSNPLSIQWPMGQFRRQ